MIQYKNLIETILKDGNYRGDRTGTGTKSIFGHQMRFDLSEGFPLVTGKKTILRSVIHELLWFLQGSTNIKYLKDNDVSIWDDWILPVNNPGKSFDLRPLIEVPPRTIVEERSEYHGDFSTNGICAPRGSMEDKLRGSWVKMMKRCYDTSHHRYEYYGAKGIFVSSSWHDVNNFINDVKSLPNWKLKAENWNDYELDKDYYSSDMYSKDTCVWLHTEENNFYTSLSFPIKIIDNSGKESIFITLNEASRQIGIPSTTLSRFISDGLPSTLKGDNKKYEGWTFTKYKSKNPLRYAFSFGNLGPVYGKQWRSWPDMFEYEGKIVYTAPHIDQISNVINDIKNNPLSRRLIVTAWNPAEIDSMALPPCHCLFQFYCFRLSEKERLQIYANRRYDEDGLHKTYVAPSSESMDDLGIPVYKLSCQLYQRSADVFLGVPFNIASYSLLLMMISKICNMVPGEFIWTGGDCHLYNNHTQQIDQYLSSEVYKLPRVIIHGDQRTIDDFKFEDFELLNYRHGDFIKAPISI